jgi:hypothetical protein
MIRRLQINLRPSEALAALMALHGPASDATVVPGISAATHAFGPRLGQEVSRVFDTHARSLDVVGACLDWLERRGVARLERPRARGARACAWQCAAELRVDVRPLLREVADEVTDADSTSRATAWALRMVLRHLASGGLHTSEVRAGSERVPAAEALASFDVAMASVGYGANAAPPPRMAHLASRSKRRDESVEAPVAEVPIAAPTAKVKAEPAAKVKAEPAAKVKAEPAAKVKAEPAAKVKAEAPPKVKASTVGGFGALPDDAVPEDRRAGEVYSARGLTLDAEFFLTEATIAQWPCDAKALERGRRLVVSKLHPDRAGDASTTSFHRAIKGHAELVKKLSVTPPVANAAPAAVTPEPVVEAAKVVETPSVNPSDAVTSVVRERPKRTRQKPVEAVVTTPPVVVPATPVASGSTYEWPPRQPEVVAAPVPVPVPALVESPIASAATRPAKRASKRVAAAARHAQRDDFDARRAV